MDSPIPSHESAPAEVPPKNEQFEAEQKRLHRRTRRDAIVVYSAAKLIFSTLRLQCENLEPVESLGTGVIYVTWHGRSLIPANVFQNRGYWALISLSRDGDMQNRIFKMLGYQIVRGSSGRSGARGALQMARKVKEGGSLTFTPDGPRGPTHKVQPGVFLMAVKSGAPIVPIGVSASSRWMVKSWDSYMVPMPFARAFMLLGDPIYVPPKVSEAARESLCIEVEHAINRLEQEAERRAGYPLYPSRWPTG